MGNAHVVSEQAGAYAVEPPARGKGGRAKRSAAPAEPGLRHRQNCPAGRVERIPGDPPIVRCIDCGEQTEGE